MNHLFHFRCSLLHAARAHQYNILKSLIISTLLSSWHASCSYHGKISATAQREPVGMIHTGRCSLYKKQKQLTADIYLKCFVCNEHEARHLCVIDWNGLNVKLCLCQRCIAFNMERPAGDLLLHLA